MQKIIQTCLLNETDHEIIKAILMNPNLPKKALIEFTKDPRAEMFDDDEELIAYVESLELTETVNK